LQVITGEVILTGSAGGSLMKDVGFRRFYNLPSLIYYFVFYAIFNNPFESKNKKKLSIVIIVITLMLPLHRVLLTSFWLLVFWGIFLWSGGLKGSIKYIFIVVLCLLPFVNILLTRFEKNTQSDVNQIIIGDFAEYVEVGTDMEMVENATMLFRIAHFYERFMYVIEDKRYIVFGAGYMSEDSALADALDFNIGLMDYESRVLQVDSPDISWSSLVLRFGIVGTLVYLCFFTALIVFCWKKRKWKLGMCSFLYLMLVFFTSISSSEFYHAWLYIIVLLNIRDSAIAEVEEQNEDNGQNTLQKVII
jgi:hypothetical protein